MIQKESTSTPHIQEENTMCESTIAEMETIDKVNIAQYRRGMEK
jgi:hypothetical protein